MGASAPEPKLEPREFDLIQVDQIVEPVIYRCFGTLDRAQKMLRGEIEISTLAWWRGLEDAARGDTGEGIHNYESGFYSGTRDSPQGQVIASRLGMRPGPGRLEVDFCSVERRLPNAWGLSTTLENSERIRADLGHYVVRIRRPLKFFEILSSNLAHEYPVERALIGYVKYRERAYEGTGPEPGWLGFVKPVDPYGYQKELRMLWVTKDGRGPVDRVTIRNGRLARFLSPADMHTVSD